MKITTSVNVENEKRESRKETCMVEMQQRIVRKYRIKVKEFSYHWHDHLVLIQVLKGSVELRVRTVDNRMDEGDIFIINSGEVHQLKAITEENLLSIVFFDHAFCRQVDSEFCERFILINSYRFENQHQEKYRIIRRYLKHLLKVLDEDEPFKIMIAAHQLLAELCLNYDFVTCGLNLERFSDKVIHRNKIILRKAIKFDSVYHDKSLKELSEILGLSYAHLRKDILTRYGRGYKWLKYNHMTESAARLIASTCLPITSIGEHCGFSDPKYMIQYFRMYYEMTPSEFRKHYHKHHRCYYAIETTNLQREWSTELNQTGLLYE